MRMFAAILPSARSRKRCGTTSSRTSVGRWGLMKIDVPPSNPARVVHAPLDQHVERNAIKAIAGLVIPLLVAAHLGSLSNIARVDQVANPSEFFRVVFIGPQVARFGIDCQRRVAVPDISKHDRVVILGNHQVIVTGEIHHIRIVKIWIGARSFHLACDKGAPIVKANELLMHMIKGSPRGSQPI